MAMKGVMPASLLSQVMSLISAVGLRSGTGAAAAES